MPGSRTESWTSETMRQAPQPAPAPPPRAVPGWVRLSVLGGLGLVLTFPLLQVAWLGLFQRDRSAVARTAQGFLDALRKRDLDTIRSFLVEGAQEQSLVLLSPLVSPFLQFDRGAVTVRNDYSEMDFTCRLVQDPGEVPRGAGILAMIPATRPMAQMYDGWRGVVYLERGDAGWRVYAVRFPADADRSGPRVDFRKAEADPVRPAAPLMPQLGLRALLAVSAEELDAAWKLDRDVANEPAGQVLKQLANELGLGIAPREMNDPALRKAVSFQWKGIGRLEAIEAVCRQLGRTSNYLGPNLVLREAPRAWPAVTSGPFLVFVDAVYESPVHATATVQLKCLALGLPASVNALTRQDDEALEITAVSGPDGRDLYHRDIQSYFPAKGSDLADRLLLAAPMLRRLEIARDIPLRQLLGDLETIPQIRGRVKLQHPAEVETARFDPLEPGTSRQLGELRLTFRQSDFKQAPSKSLSVLPQTTLRFDVEGQADGRLLWIAYNAGTSLMMGRVRRDADGACRLEVPTATTAVHFQLVSAVAQYHEFVLRDVPLTQRPPKRLLPAEFPGHEAPVSVQARVFATPVGDRARLQLDLRNHSQKDVDRLELLLVYRDAAGNALTEQQVTIATFDAFQHRLRVLVPAHASNPHTIEDAERPAQTQAITATVTRVGFADGLTWSPKKE